MKHVFRKNGPMACPTDERGLKAWRKLKDGDLLYVETGRQRSLRHHRLYWATMNFFAEHSRRTPEQIHTLMKDLTGRYDVVQRQDGSEVRCYHKTDFASMDEDAFQAYHEDMKRALWLEVMPNVPEGTMRKELEAFLK